MTVPVKTDLMKKEVCIKVLSSTKFVHTVLKLVGKKLKTKTLNLRNKQSIY